MKPAILSSLKALEQEQHVEVLYACESGSRAWDFASIDSDWDCRFIYKRELRDYIILSPPRDVIELPLQNDLDINGWDIYKALQLASKSNPALMEWLFSPIVYRESGSFAERLRNYVHQHYSPRAIAHHYLHMAGQNHHKYLQGKVEVLRKKYLYVLRPLFCLQWLEVKQTMPPTRFLDVLEGISTTKAMEKAVDQLLKDKRAGGELGKGPRERVLDDYVRESLHRWKERVDRFPVRKANAEILNELLRKELL